jgi:hypothetical protein
MFITAFTRSLRLSLSWNRPIQCTPPHPISTRSILMLSTHLSWSSTVMDRHKWVAVARGFLRCPPWSISTLRARNTQGSYHPEDLCDMFSETSVLTRGTRCNIPKDIRRFCEIPKADNSFFLDRVACVKAVAHRWQWLTRSVAADSGDTLCETIKLTLPFQAKLLSVEASFAVSHDTMGGGRGW